MMLRLFGMELFVILVMSEVLLLTMMRKRAQHRVDQGRRRSRLASRRPSHPRRGLLVRLACRRSMVTVTVWVTYEVEWERDRVRRMGRRRIRVRDGGLWLLLLADGGLLR